jgi:hypothetical protein
MISIVFIVSERRPTSRQQATGMLRSGRECEPKTFRPKRTRANFKSESLNRGVRECQLRNQNVGPDNVRDNRVAAKNIDSEKNAWPATSVHRIVIGP